MLERLVKAYINYNDNLTDALEDLHEFVKEIRRNAYPIADKIESNYKDEARENDYCPMCFVPLEIKEFQNEPCEYQGREVTEPIIESICPLCGHRAD